MTDDSELTTGELLQLIGALGFVIADLETVAPIEELSDMMKLQNKLVKILANKMGTKND